MNVQIDKKDDIVLKILHYFITEEDYKPVIINGLTNEIWLENMEKDLKLIRINNNYIHNDTQLKNDTYKAKQIMRSIKKSTLSFRMNMLNLLLDTGEAVTTFDMDNIETIKVDQIGDFKKNSVVNEFFPGVKTCSSGMLCISALYSFLAGSITRKGIPCSFQSLSNKLTEKVVFPEPGVPTINACLAKSFSEIPMVSPSVDLSFPISISPALIRFPAYVLLELSVSLTFNPAEIRFVPTGSLNNPEASSAVIMYGSL